MNYIVNININKIFVIQKDYYIRTFGYSDETLKHNYKSRQNPDNYLLISKLRETNFYYKITINTLILRIEVERGCLS